MLIVSVVIFVFSTLTLSPCPLCLEKWGSWPPAPVGAPHLSKGATCMHNISVLEWWSTPGNLATTYRSLFHFNLVIVSWQWGTGIRRLMRGMATLPQGNQELLVVRDKVGWPQVSLGKQVHGMWYFSLQCFDSVGSGDRKGIRPVKNWMLVCWWWWFDWSYAWLIAPVVTTTRSSNLVFSTSVRPGADPGIWERGCNFTLPSSLPLPLEVGPLIQLGGLGECCKLPSGVWGGALSAKAILAYLEPRKGIWWQGFRFLLCP